MSGVTTHQPVDRQSVEAVGSSAQRAERDLDLEIAIVTCNNEDTIRRTLESVAPIARRITLVDSGSDDRTLEIADEFGAHIVRHPWQGYVAQKQFALEQCSANWVFCIDSDESLDEELRTAIASAIQRHDASIAGYEVNRRVFFLGGWLRYTFQPEWRLRLVRRETARWAGYDPHDRLEVVGRIARIPGILRHDSWRNVTDLFQRQIKHGVQAGESYHQLGRRGGMIELLISPAGTLIKQLIIRRAFLDGWRGVICAVAASFGVAAKYARLMELKQKFDSDG